MCNSALIYMPQISNQWMHKQSGTLWWSRNLQLRWELSSQKNNGYLLWEPSFPFQHHLTDSASFKINPWANFTQCWNGYPARLKGPCTFFHKHYMKALPKAFIPEFKKEPANFFNPTRLERASELGLFWNITNFYFCSICSYSVCLVSSILKDNQKCCTSTRDLTYYWWDREEKKARFEPRPLCTKLCALPHCNNPCPTVTLIQFG